MEKEPRKASEVILELEDKVNKLLGLVQSQDLTMKVLSNKLNSLMEKLDKPTTTAPKIMVEAVNTFTNSFNQESNSEKSLPVSSDFNLSIESNPTGFRRTSRPETYAGDNSYLPPQVKVPEQKFPTQIPRPSGQAEIIVPTNINKQAPASSTPKKSATVQFSNEGNSIPVSQRVVDGNGKSVFLADVEITNLSALEDPPFKTRTNATGKWNAPLQHGAYRVTIRKRESLTKEKLEAAQDIQVDGSTSPFELPLMIIKK